MQIIRFFRFVQRITHLRCTKFILLKINTTLLSRTDADSTSGKGNVVFFSAFCEFKQHSLIVHCCDSSDTTVPMSSATQIDCFSIFFGQYASLLFMHAYIAFGFAAVIFMKGYFIMPGVLKPTLDAMVEWDTDYKSSLKDL